MKAIVAVDCNWGIGANNELLARIPEDIQRFKKMTKGHQVIMGRKTLESLPGKKPLSCRTNIVLTKQDLQSCEDLIFMSSVEEVTKIASPDCFVIGGQSVYEQFLDMCDTVYVTMIYKSYFADKFFPNLDRNMNWIEVEQSELKEYGGVHYRFITYARRQAH